MPVTELAILTLVPGTTCGPTATTLQHALQHAKTVQEKASGFPAYYFQQIEDPNVLYIIGSWESGKAHFDFLPSAENQGALKRFEGLLSKGEGDGVVIFHLDCDITNLGEGRKIEELFTAPAVSINRHFIKGGKKSEFARRMNEVQPLLEAYTSPRPVVGGWRIETEKDEQGNEKEEWVLISGFESVDQHFEFPKSKDWDRYSSITDFVDGYELEHAKLLGI